MLLRGGVPLQIERRSAVPDHDRLGRRPFVVDRQGHVVDRRGGGHRSVDRAHRTRTAHRIDGLDVDAQGGARREPHRTSVGVVGRSTDQPCE